MQILIKKQIDFLKYRWFWLAVSLLAVSVGVAAILTPGAVNLGIDFSGGTQLIVRFDPDVSLDRLRSTLEDAGLAAQIQRFGAVETGEVLIKVAGDGAAGAAVAAVRAALAREPAFSGYTVLNQEYVGPQVGSELRFKSVLAVLFSTLGILGYIWWRFELRFALGTVVAMVHDVFVSVGLYALMGYELNLTTIAAFLTLVGYSVNDSVVVFDRVRENLRQRRRDPLYEVLNTSLNQTLSRTLLTNFTVLLAAGALLALGGPTLRGFSFVLTVGVFVGTYSTIYIASPITLLWDRLVVRRSERGQPPASEDGTVPGPGARERETRKHWRSA